MSNEGYISLSNKKLDYYATLLYIFTKGFTKTSKKTN